MPTTTSGHSHANCGPLNLREALNKLGHYSGDLSTYRVDGRGAHYLVLGGRCSIG